MLIELLALVAVVTAGVIAGGAWAYTLEIHPAMLKISPKASLEIFTPMFKHANTVQPLMGGVVAVSALAISWLSGNWFWFAGAVVMQLVGPYTIFGMMPLNRRLMDADLENISAETLCDLKKWGLLHMARTLMNTAVFVFFCGLLVWGG